MAEQSNLEPEGKYVIQVCAGTNCYQHGAKEIYQAIQRHLRLDLRQKTSADGLFTLKSASCFGSCGVPPAMMVNGKVYGKMTPASTLELLDKIREREETCKGFC